MAHVFADATNPTYDADTAKWNDGSFNLNYTPYDYGDETTFMQQVDISVAGMQMDCAECHVGGGPNEYVPSPLGNPSVRVSFRDIYDVPLSYADPDGDGTPEGFQFSTTDYTAFTKFIDTFDVDGDGDLLEVQTMDYRNTGVMEVDCFLCHLQGYNYTDRREMLREAKLDASRVVGAGVGDANVVAWDDGNATAPAGYGTEVTYNNYVQPGNGTFLKFSYSILDRIKYDPPSDNCSFCHFGHGAVDWKKRGDNWTEANQTYEVHKVIGCMGCHQGKVGTVIGTEFTVDGNLGHDPAKGIGQFQSNWNALDGTIKTCEDCHLNGGYDATLDTTSPAYGAPNPTGAHQALGLSAVICQTGIDGTVNASHLDIIDCAVCHVRKISTASWNTGGALVDATGKDADGRLADHENIYVSRFMYDNVNDVTNLSYSWLNGKIIATSVLNTVYWRDKNDVNHDVNADGRGGGMDTPLMTHVLAVNMASGWAAMTSDLSGNIADADVATRISALEAALPGLTGKPNAPHIKLTTMAVPFKVNHNVAPKQYALGKLCSDCHGAANGIYHGQYAMQGTLTNLNYNNATQGTPLTKANSFEDPTDFHPNTKNKTKTRTIPIRMFSNNTTMRPIDRAELLYETTFKARNTAWHDDSSPISSVSAIGFPGAGTTTFNTKGWWLKVEVDSDLDGVADVTRTRMVTAFCTDVTALLANLASGTTSFVDGFEFTITDNSTGGISITADAGTQIRLNPATSAGAFKFGDAVWTAASHTGVDGNAYADRAAWVAYLDGIQPADAGIGVDPVADIATIDGQDPDVTSPYIEVVQGNTVAVVAADAAAAGSFTYSWNFSDSPDAVAGQSVNYQFNNTGLITVFLTVIDEENKISQQSVQVNVVVPGPQTSFTYSATAGSPSVILSLSNLPTHDMLYYYYGDGRRERVYHTGAVLAHGHNYRLRSRYLSGGSYNYLTSVRIYNGTTLVETVQRTISIPQ